MIRVTARLEDGASDALSALLSALDGDERTSLNRVGGRSAQDAAAKYHREFDSRGGWKGSRYLGPAPGQGSSFGANVAGGWSLESADADSATIANDAEHLGFKATGGTIVPKRAKALTIPLIQEAKGVRASVYSQNTGHKLFTIKGKNALFERLGVITTGSRGRRGQAGATNIQQSRIRAVYALMKSVTMRPWPGALPPDELLSSAFANRYIDELERIVDAS